jgi:hypothetical protein
VDYVGQLCGARGRDCAFLARKAEMGEKGDFAEGSVERSDFEDYQSGARFSAPSLHCPDWEQGHL